MNPPSYASLLPCIANAQPQSRLSLSLSCKNLKNLDTLSKSDPQIFFYHMDGERKVLLGKTEKLKDTLNPTFSTAIQVDYFFEAVQNVKIMVVDVDSTSDNPSDQDMIGCADVSLAQLVSAPGGVFETELMHKGKGGRGKVFVTTEEVSGGAVELTLHLSGAGLDAKDFFGKSDPYVTVHKAREDGTWILVHKTEVVKKTLNPHWTPLTIPMAALCGGDPDRAIRIECFDWDSNSAHDLIGVCQVTARELVSGASFPLINEKKKAKKKSYTDSGKLLVTKAQLVEKKTFTQYLQSGLQMNLMVAVDFTASNGSPSLATSLHYASPHAFNQYQQAMHAVGSVLLEYDSDKMVPIYGYGAKIQNAQVSHCFPLTFNPTQPEVHGVDGMLAAYANGINNVELYGPTNLSPILRQAQAVVQARPQDYLVLMILTDGVISDSPQTIEELVKMSGMPISVVIVGVGNADFTAMNVLDGDDGCLADRAGNKAQRDIVQFVPFNTFAQKGPAALAAEVLREIPKQVVSALSRSK